MARLAFFSLPATGHLNPMTALGCELQERGHVVTFYQIEDSAAAVEAVGLRCRVLGKDQFPIGTMPRFFAELGRLRGRAGLAYTLEFLSRLYEMTLREAPDVLSEDRIDALLVDQAGHAVGSVAERLNLPFVNICNCLLLNEEVGIPPFNLDWRYDPGWRGRLRTRAALQLINWALYRPIFKKLNGIRREWGLHEIRKLNDVFSTLAQISQQPPEFEFPRRELPAHFHFTGPFHRRKSRAPVVFPWERIDGRPLIFASMGTIQNGMEWVFRIIAEACAGFDLQLVMSLGGNITPESLGTLPGNPLVVKYAPQLELIEKARLVITHAGLNTALEALTQGVPMVAIPVTNDQPAVAARIAWTNTGVVLPLKRLDSQRLRQRIATVLGNDTYRQAAQRIQARIAEANGLRKAADIVERCFSKPTEAARNATSSL
ncbi:MAG TPA: glycosyltransferase [Terriglobales bacterium]|nr:glycosyltransferase [Terriglobales bacterium]